MWPTRSKRGANGGELVPGVSARLIKSDGTLADYNEPGELYLKTPAAALRYLDNEEGSVTFVTSSMHLIRTTQDERDFCGWVS
jgi:acyl-coenzyme A synthetase/AMP-(fatty) acid ligase